MITGEMSVESVVGQYPAAVRFLMERGIVCIQCGEPVWGNLYELFERKGIQDKEQLIRQLETYVNAAD